MVTNIILSLLVLFVVIDLCAYVYGTRRLGWAWPVRFARALWAACRPVSVEPWDASDEEVCDCEHCEDIQ
jgi:hypothetical protein